MWDFVVDYFTNMTFNLILIKYVYNISINVEFRSQSFVDKKNSWLGKLRNFYNFWGKFPIVKIIILQIQFKNKIKVCWPGFC